MVNQSEFWYEIKRKRRKEKTKGPRVVPAFTIQALQVRYIFEFSFLYLFLFVLLNSSFRAVTLGIKVVHFISSLVVALFLQLYCFYS